MQLTITRRKILTPDIVEFTLESANGEVLPPVNPGDHITVETPSGTKRRYSLVHPGDNLTAYTLAIKLEPKSRGGSISMHKDAVVGSVLEIDDPENEFSLGSGHASILIAGGIGVTPIYSMAQRLIEEGRNFKVIYCSRSAESSAYVDELRQLCGDALTVHHDGGDPTQAFDFWSILGRPTLEHVYCCGPSPLMDEIKAMTGHWKEGHVHFEEFQPLEIIRARQTLHA